MGQATYNAAGGAYAIIPYPGVGASPELTFGCCLTREYEGRIARRVYAFPGLSGMGSEHCGVRSQRIDWELTVVAASAANLQTFIDRFDYYRHNGGRFDLVSERGTGRHWERVELVAVVPQEEQVLVGGSVRWQGVIQWENMQPSLVT